MSQLPAYWIGQKLMLVQKNLPFEMEENLQSVSIRIKDILVFYGIEYSAKHQHSLLLRHI